MRGVLLSLLMCFCKYGGHTFPVVSTRGSEHNVMEVFSEGGRYPLLARAKLFMASQPAITETPVSPIHIVFDLEILTEDVTPSEDVSRLLLCVHVLTLFVTVCTRLQTVPPCYFRLHRTEALRQPGSQSKPANASLRGHQHHKGPRASALLSENKAPFQILRHQFVPTGDASVNSPVT